MGSEIADRARFDHIRYAQCWEDADILLQALDIQPHHVCVSIASAGDNALAMLSQAPQRVVAIDLSPAQLACLELRVAAYRELSHEELLVLIGSRPGTNRSQLYQRCRSQLSTDVRYFWDHHSTEIERGIGSAGKFERYFALFRQWVLPLVHHQRRVKQLLNSGMPPNPPNLGGYRDAQSPLGLGDLEGNLNVSILLSERDAAAREIEDLEDTALQHRREFYQQQWDTWRWRSLFRIFFSRWVMGRAGRDPSFFKYVEGNVADRILHRTHYALTELNPADNSYLQWILTGYHPTALPYALRPKHFDSIRANLDRLEWRCSSLEDFLNDIGQNAIDCYNLSDIFEYLSPANYHQLLQRLVNASHPHARLAYWNMLAPRSRPDHMADQLQPLTDLAQSLYAQDKAFFYSAFVVEEVLSAEC